MNRRFLAIALSLPFLILAGWELTVQTYDYWGIDIALYVRDAERFLATGSPYNPYQLTGQPYDIGGEIFLYPPVALFLVTPFAWLPRLLWWLIPLGVFAYGLIVWRPRWYVWPLLAMILAWPRTLGALQAGNTDLWIVAFTTAGLLWGWPWLLVLVKPSVAPVLVFGVRDWRRITTGFLPLAAMSFLTLPLWPQYVTAALNAKSPGLLYSLPNAPMLLAPVLAWALRTRAPDVETEREVVGVGALTPDHL